MRGFSETGYSYFGARYYDSDLSGLFLSVDPMSDKYPNISPYSYCAWNPVRLVDPDGRELYEWQFDVQTREMTKVGNNGGGATHQTVSVVYPDGSSFVVEGNGQDINIQSACIGGNYFLRVDIGNMSQSSPSLATIGGVCRNMEMSLAIPDEVTQGLNGIGNMFLGAASPTDNFPGSESQYINKYQSYCREKYNMYKGSLTSRKVAELSNNYKIIKGFGKVSRLGGGTLSLLGTYSEGVNFYNNPSFGNGIRLGLSATATIAGLTCATGPAAPFVAIGVMTWGIFDAIWGDNFFDF